MKPGKQDHEMFSRTPTSAKTPPPQPLWFSTIPMNQDHQVFNKYPVWVIGVLISLLCGLSISKAHAAFTSDCTQNGGTVAECVAPTTGPWIASGTESFDCFVVPVLLFQFRGTGADPNSAVDDYVVQRNNAYAVVAAQCGINLGVEVRTTSCNNSTEIFDAARGYAYIQPGCVITNSLTQVQGLVGALQYIDCPGNYGVVGTLNVNGYDLNAPYACMALFSSRNLGCPRCENAVGDPMNIGLGNQYEAEFDYRSAGPLPLEFARFFNSRGKKQAGTGLGFAWRTTYDRSIDTFAGTAYATAHVNRNNGKSYTYKLDASGGVTSASPDIIDKLVQLLDVNGKRTGWRLTIANTGHVENYSASGQLLSVASRSGLTQTLGYDSQGRLLTVVDYSGRQLTFTYDSNNRISTMANPAGDVFTYAYNTNGDLASVTGPDGATRNYQYGVGNPQHLVTVIQDENGQQSATFTYDGAKRVTSSQLGSGADKVIVVWGYGGSLFSSPAIVTDALGAKYTYTTNTIQGVAKVGSITRTCAGCTSSDLTTISYDSNGNVQSRRDYNGNLTTYVYDTARNLEISRTEAYGTTQARTIQTQWHSTYSLPVKIAEPKRLTTFSYDASGNRLTKTEQATTDTNGAQGFTAAAVGTPRTWTYTYNAVGQVLTEDGPRTDVADKTAYAYDTSGNLKTITNAAGHVTTLSNYDTHGRPGKIIDPKSLITELSYSSRGWLIQRKATGPEGVEITGYSYHDAGQLKRVTFPDNSFLSYTYDSASRLTDIVDSLGNSVRYGLDAMGNRLQDQIKDAGGTLTRQISRVYDSLNRLQQVTGGQQ